MKILSNLSDPIHLSEKHLPEITFPRKSLGRNYINSNGHSLNVHLPEITFSRTLHALTKNYISPKAHLAEITFARIYISPKTYFLEFTFGRNYISRKLIFQNLHLAKITFPRKLIFQNLLSPEFIFGRNYISPKNHFSRNYTHQPEISLLIEFTIQKYIIMIVRFQKLTSYDLRVEQKGQRRAFSHVFQLILTYNVGFKIFLVFDKIKCHFQNYSFKVCDGMRCV